MEVGLALRMRNKIQELYCYNEEITQSGWVIQMLWVIYNENDTRDIQEVLH